MRAGTAGVAVGLLALGCAPVDEDRTLVSELRTVAVEANPPEVGLGETLQLRLFHHDPAGPAGEGFDMALWLCTPVEGGCQEAELTGLPLSLLSRVVRGAPTEQELLFPIPAVPGDLFIGSAEVVPVIAWIAVCRPGACPIIDALEADPELASEAYNETVGLMARVDTWLRDVPRDAGSVAVRRVFLSLRPSFERLTNPLILLRSELSPLPPDREVELRFATTAETLVPYTSAGRFTQNVASGSVDAPLVLRTPAGPGPFRVWVVADSDRGGQAVFTAELTVE